MRQRRKTYLTLYCMIVLVIGMIAFGPARTVNAETAVDANGKAVQEEPVRVLLVGNSLTKYGKHSAGRTVQGHLKKMATASGKTLIVKTVAFSGAALRNYVGLNPKKEKQAKRFQKQLKSEEWDYVIIQELTRLHYEKYEERTIPAIKEIVRLVEKHSPDAEIMFYLPRGFDFIRKESGSDISAMEMECHIGATGERIESYFGIELIPVGMHCYRCSIQYPDIKLMGTDKRHPSKAGYFLAASCIYQKIFHEQPKINATVLDHAEISKTEAEQLIGLWGEGIKSCMSEVVLHEGDTYVMRVVDEKGAPVSEVRYVSMDETVAAVDDVTGEITATGSGMTVIMAETIEGWQTYCTVYVPYATPTGLEAKADVVTMANGQCVASVQLKWEKQDNARYAVYRAESAKGPYKLLKKVKKGRYVDTTATSGKTWYYKIAAVNGYAECKSKRTKAIAVSLQ